MVEMILSSEIEIEGIEEIDEIDLFVIAVKLEVVETIIMDGTTIVVEEKD